MICNTSIRSHFYLSRLLKLPLQLLINRLPIRSKFFYQNNIHRKYNFNLVSTQFNNGKYFSDINHHKGRNPIDTYDTNHTDTDNYIEQWQREQIKSTAFYENEAKSHRHYFYTIDLQGRLFLEESRVKNIATSLKDSRFLSFFFKRLQLNMTGKYEQEYPFVSPCGKEMNYIKPADIPIVFTSKIKSEPISVSDTFRRKNGGSVVNVSFNNVSDQQDLSIQREKIYLEYNNSGLKIPYRPQNLRVSSVSGKLYYKLSSEKTAEAFNDVNKTNVKGGDSFQNSDKEKDQGRNQYPGLHFGLLKSQLVLEIEKDLYYGETAEDEDVLYMKINEEDGENRIKTDDQKQTTQKIIQIEILPIEYEPFYGLRNH